MPPSSFGLRIDTPPIVEVPGEALAASNGAAGAAAAPPPPRPPPPPPPRPPRPPLGATYPGGGGIAPKYPHESCGELNANCEHGSFCTSIVLRPLWPPT